MPESRSVRRGRRLGWGRRIAGAAGLLVVTTLAIATGGAAHLTWTLDDAERVDLSDSLRAEAERPTKTENYLLVGSDSRAGADPDAPDFGGIGGEEDVGGRRSDSIMVLRFDPKTGDSVILSLPRDLWVEIYGTGEANRLNSAFATSEEVLVNTITTELGIPIDHYVEVDFSGFKRLVDAIGGVEVFFELPTRDKNTGLAIPEPGCYRLDGVQALQYVRSRHFEQRLNGKWREDPTSDLGRMSRQRDFIRRSIDQAVSHVAGDPLGRLNDLVGVGLESVRMDDDLNALGLAGRLVEIGGSEPLGLTLPIYEDTVDGNAVLRIDEEEAAPILAFFRGEVEPQASTSAGGSSATTVAANPVTTAPVLPTQETRGTVPDPARDCG